MKLPSIFSRWRPHSLEHQLMLLTAVCLVASILGYGAYTAKQQTTLARQTITAQMSALAHNLATVDAYFLKAGDLLSIDAIAIQTATVPGIYSVLVTDVRGQPLSEVVNKNGQWSPRFSTTRLTVPTTDQPLTHIEPKEATASMRDFLAGNAGKISAWHPIIADQPLGWVRVSYRLDGFDQAARHIWSQALLVIALAIGATLCLLALLLRPPMRALRAATRFAGELDHAQGAKMDVSTGTTEVQALGNALNVVSERLFTQNKDLLNQKFALDQHAIVSITDLSGHITYANQRFCDISGYSQAELIGQNHRLVKSGLQSPALFAALWHTISAGQVWRGEMVNRKKDGRHYWVDATLVPLMGADGLPQQYIAIRTDITAIKEMEKSLQAAKVTAESANQAKSEFLANMSHEIRTPMNGILGMTELTLDTNLDPTQRSYLDTVNSSAQALLVILNDILDFSKIEAGKLHIESIDFSLRHTITDTLKPLIVRARKKGLELTCQLAPGLPDQVIGDPGRIRQILTNLCDNALKFTPQGHISIDVHYTALEADGYEIRFAVRDSGIGIAPDKQQGIFAAFSQADNSTTRRFGGTGLGLTICARLVALMGGRMGVDSEEGRGSTFYFTVYLTTGALEAARRDKISNAGKVLPSSTSRKAPPPVEI